MAFTSDEDLVDEFTGDGEDLHAPSATVCDVHEAVGRNLHRVHRRHELRSAVRTHRLLWGRRTWRRIVDRCGAESAPHPFKRAGVGVEHDDALVAVSVCNEQFVRFGIYENIRGFPKVLRVPVGLLLATLTDLHDELAGLREFQNLIIIAVAANPDKTFWIDINSMFRLRPVITGTRATPTLDEVALYIELQHRRRGLRLFFRAQRVRPLQHP